MATVRIANTAKAEPKGQVPSACYLPKSSQYTALEEHSAGR